MPKDCLAWNVPLPLPSSTLAVLSPSFAATRSLLPSPLKSPTAARAGPLPVPKDCLAWNVPLPLPSSTLAVSSELVDGDQVTLAVAVEVAHERLSKACFRCRRPAWPETSHCHCQAERSRCCRLRPQ